MKSTRAAVGAVCLFGLTIICGAQPFGLSNRVGNTTLRLPPVPPVYGLAASNAFSNLAFVAPIAIVSPPGDSNRVFIVEQSGRISVITNLANPTSTLFISLSNRVNFNGEQGLLGLAFHPGYLSNRFFYAFYVTPAPRHNRLSRFEIDPINPNRGLANTEVILINQPDDYGNHNAGDLHFGADGYLYVSLGDEGDANDTGQNSQRIDKDFFSGILRLDVDKLPGSLAPTPHPASSTNYAVPPDNPFVNTNSFNGLPLTGNVRTEFWAVGLRNPWRMSFDRVTGLLYCGDVGQGQREEIDIIEKGRNYGWNYREGKIARPNSPAPPAGFSGTDPIIDYPRTPAGATNVGFSVTGGVVYRGNRLPELNGAYIFGDYGSGNIWALRHSGTNVAWWRILNDPGVAAFGTDPSNGDLLYADVVEGRIKRLTNVLVSGFALPVTLADAGVFSDLTALTPHSGIVSYDVNLPGWFDNAEQRRWFYVPTNRTITYRATNNWSFPTGAVWVQHFELELTNGAPASRRRLETRVLVRDSGTAAYGVTYRWDDSQTNATLVGENGMEEALVLDDGGGNVRTQTWRYPGRAECLRCHTSVSQGGLAIGFNTAQLNRDFDYGGVVDNQIRSLNNAGYFAQNTPATNLHALRSLAHPADEAHSVESRVRSYLAVNCGHCHQPGGAGTGNFDARLFRALPAVGLVNGLLVNNGGNTNNRVVRPVSLEHSMLLTRMATLATNRMPPLVSLLDTQAIQLISRWITNDLASYRTFAEWQVNHFGATNAPNAGATVDADLDGANNMLEYLTGTDPNTFGDGWRIGVERAGESAEVILPRVANRGIEVQWSTNLGNASNWRFLNVPENRPFFSSSNITTRLPEPLTNAEPKFYRVRVYEH